MSADRGKGDRVGFGSHAKDLLRPLHRWVAGLLPLTLRRVYLYAATKHRLPRLRRPVTFTEKVTWRILHDRRPGIAERCDKRRMKEIAAALVPAADLRIPRTLWHGTDLRDVPAELWDGPWVLKPNHGSGAVILGDGPPAMAALHRTTRSWLRDEQGARLGEWGYRGARREILLEERVRAPVGAVAPADYKVHCFDGRPVCVHVEVGRGGPAGGRGRTFYDTAWRRLPVRQDGLPNPEVPRPEVLETMLEVAGTLAAGWDYMRVDLYLSGSTLWFGEFTPYPGGGVGRYQPESADRWLGDLWTLPDAAELASDR